MSACFSATNCSGVSVPLARAASMALALSAVLASGLTTTLRASTALDTAAPAIGPPNAVAIQGATGASTEPIFFSTSKGLAIFSHLSCQAQQQFIGCLLGVMTVPAVVSSAIVVVPGNAQPGCRRAQCRNSLWLSHSTTLIVPNHQTIIGESHAAGV